MKAKHIGYGKGYWSVRLIDDKKIILYNTKILHEIYKGQNIKIECDACEAEGGQK